jgi:hypothetical protein
MLLTVMLIGVSIGSGSIHMSGAVPPPEVQLEPPDNFEIKVGDTMKDVITKWGYPDKISNPSLAPGLRVDFGKPSPFHECAVHFIYREHKVLVAISDSGSVVGVFAKKPWSKW